MYATSFFLLLPADTRRRLLDAVNEVPGRFFLERRDDLHAGDVLRRMMAARMEKHYWTKTRTNQQQDDELGHKTQHDGL